MFHGSQYSYFPAHKTVGKDLLLLHWNHRLPNLMVNSQSSFYQVCWHHLTQCITFSFQKLFFFLLASIMPHTSTLWAPPSPLLLLPPLSEKTPSSSCLILLSHFLPLSLFPLSSIQTGFADSWTHRVFPALNLWYLLSLSSDTFPSYICMANSHFIQVSAQISLLCRSAQSHSEVPHFALFFFKEIMIWNYVIICLVIF